MLNHIVININVSLERIMLLKDRDAKLIKNDNSETQIDVLKNRQSTKLKQKILQLLKKHFNILSIEYVIDFL